MKQNGTCHAGGQIAFGPRAMLYMALGEARKDGIRDLESVRSRILRIDVDRHTESDSEKGTPALPYATPRDNPFFGKPSAHGEV